MTPEAIITKACENLRAFQLRNWQEVRRLCESPIEELFLAAVFGSNIGRGVSPINIHASGYREGANAPSGDHLWPQAPVGQYRLDFLFCRFATDGSRRRVAVECDGHDFHERTKEQAAHDKARDRFLASQNICVLRFTGSEIHRDPYKCLGEVINILWGVAKAA